MQETETFVSVIIPTYNRRNTLEKTIDSLIPLSYPKEKYEIIVVDDGSTDGTYEYLKEKQKKNPNLRVFRQGHKGCAAARNLGIKNAKGEIIFFTDDDCLVEKDWINEHLRHYNDKKVGGVGGILWPIKMNYIEEYKIAIYLDEYTEYMEVTDPKSGKGLGTNNCSYRRGMFDIAGPFDEAFITGSDPEFSKRVMLKGYKIIKDPSIRVYHLKIEPLKSFLRAIFKRSEWILLEKRKHKNLQKKKAKGKYIKHFTNLWRKFCYVRRNMMNERIGPSIMIKFTLLCFMSWIIGKLGNLYYGKK